MTLIRNIKTFQIIKQWATISEHSLSTILSRAESKEILSKKDEKQRLVSFYNLDKKGKNQARRKRWITVQYKISHIMNVECTSHLERGLQNSANRNLGFSQHFNNSVILPICKYILMYRKFVFSTEPFLL